MEHKFFCVNHPETYAAGTCSHRVHIFTLLIGIDLAESLSSTVNSKQSLLKCLLIELRPKLLVETLLCVNKTCQVALNSDVEV